MSLYQPGGRRSSQSSSPGAALARGERRGSSSTRYTRGEHPSGGKGLELRKLAQLFNYMVL